MPKPRGDESTLNWRNFRFEVKVGINVEPGDKGEPRFDVDVEDVKRGELEGITGTLAKFMGRSFDKIVRQAIDGKASKMNDKLNAEILKRVQAFQDYGVFRGIDYGPGQVVLHFDVTRYILKGVAGYLYPTEQPGTVPLQRWTHIRRADHVYTVGPVSPNPKIYRQRWDRWLRLRPPAARDRRPARLAQPDRPLLHGRPGRRSAYRRGYQPDGIACHLYPQPQPGTVPFYRFAEPRYGLHFYTTHPNAEFAK